MPKRRIVLLGTVTLLAIAIAIAYFTFRTVPLQTILTRLESDSFSGVVLIAEGEQIVHQAGYGFASCDDSTANTIDTVQAIGSVTKMFTAAAIGQLDDRGALNIDDPISNYFDNLPVDKADITIQQLLDHTSGLETYHETGSLGDFEVMTKDEAFREIMSRPLLFSPGDGEEYSNSGYSLLAIVIEAASGQAYTDYVREHILVPAGMLSTGFWGESFEPIAATPNQVLGCSSPDSWDYSWVLAGNGGMVSTVGDMHRWILALQGDAVLSVSAKKRLGFDALLREGFGEAGGSSQHEFNATIEYDGKSNVTVVAISNRNTLLAEDIGVTLLRSAVRELD